MKPLIVINPVQRQNLCTLRKHLMNIASKGKVFILFFVKDILQNVMNSGMSAFQIFSTKFSGTKGGKCEEMKAQGKSEPKHFHFKKYIHKKPCKLQ